MDTATWVAVIRLVLKLAGVESVSAERIQEIAGMLVNAWQVFFGDEPPSADDMMLPDFQAYIENLNEQADAQAAKENKQT